MKWNVRDFKHYRVMSKLLNVCVPWGLNQMTKFTTQDHSTDYKWKCSVTLKKIILPFSRSLSLIHSLTVSFFKLEPRFTSIRQAHRLIKNTGRRAYVLLLTSVQSENYICVNRQMLHSLYIHPEYYTHAWAHDTPTSWQPPAHKRDHQPVRRTKGRPLRGKFPFMITSGVFRKMTVVLILLLAHCNSIMNILFSESVEVEYPIIRQHTFLWVDAIFPCI